MRCPAVPVSTHGRKPALPVAAPNPFVPAGGLYVQQDPSSSATTPTAFAALRFAVPEGASGVVTLKLTQAAPAGAALSAKKSAPISG